MPSHTPTLHLLCGKIAAGKSTLARQLAEGPDTLLIAEDRWLSRLYPDEIQSLQDYVRCSGRLKDAMEDHVVSLLRTGLSVVLDFPANTRPQRQWLRGVFEQAASDHRLHYLDVADAVCKERLKRRNRDAAHPFAVSEDDFELFTSHFVPPAPDEGFDVIVYKEA